MSIFRLGERSKIGRRGAGLATTVFGVLALLIGFIGWVEPVGATTPQGPFAVDMTNREDVRRLYERARQSTDGFDQGWTGNVARCEPGSLSGDYVAALNTRFNYYRTMAGVSSNVVVTPANNAKAQATALILAAERRLSHNPPPTWKCWTQLGVEGAASNESSGTGVAALDGLMYDGSEVGHRRIMLNPDASATGFGSIPSNPDGGTALTHFVEVKPGGRAPRDTFVAWPPSGFVPYQVVYPLWSFVLRGGDFSNSTVTMTRNGAPIGSTITSRTDFAGPGIVWTTDLVAQGATWPKPAADDRLAVRVANVVVNGVPQVFDYAVTVFDPAVAPSALRINGPTTAAVGTQATYSVDAVPGATGYQWRATAMTPFGLNDGAENGLTNFTALVDQYNPVSTNQTATGASSFRLTVGQPARVQGPALGRQTLTLNQPIVSSAGSELRFKSRANGLSNVTNVVEASVDDGRSWTPIFTETAIQEPFGDRAIPLGALAGQVVRLRFRAEPAGTGGWSCCGSEGWYIDDVALVNTFAANITLSAVSPTPSFTITAAASPLLLNARAQFNGDWLDNVWSPAKTVNPPAPAVAPAITTQPQTVQVEAGATATFAVAATGTAPLSFAWARNGVDLVDGAGVSGARTATLRLDAVTAAQAGTYSARVTNAAGTVLSNAVTLTVNAVQPPKVTLATAVNNFAFNWTTSGDAPWVGQTAVSQDGVSAARSGTVAASQRSTLNAAGVSGPATVSYWWKVDSELNFDFLTLELDGTQPFAGISGNVDWQQRSVNVPAGTHTLQWHYSKDDSVSGGADAGWVDQVTVTPVAAPPTAPTLAAALNTAREINTAGDAPWATDTTVARDGLAVRSGRLSDGQTSRLTTTVTGPTTLSFWWKVDSELGFDFLTVEVDGTQPFAGISGQVDWQQRTIAVPAGTHSIAWRYTKDGSVAAGLDAGWVDQLSLT